MAGGNSFTGAVHAGPKPAPGGRNVGMARAAHARVGGAHPAAPANWLQPLNPQQVVQQATSMVKAAYQPAMQGLDQQSSQASNILAKQEADNKYYQSWLDSKTAALQTQQNQVEQTTNQLEQQLTGNQLSQYGTQSSTLINAANAREGNVSSNSQSSAFNANLAQNQAAMQTVEGGAAQHMLAGENNAQAEVGAATANTGAVLQAGAQRETAAFNNAMTKIAGLRSTLTSNEAASIEKEIARLQGVQINIAQSNRNFDTAATKLGLQAANTNSQINTRAANTAIAKQRLQIDWAKVSQSDQRFQLDKQKFGWQTARDVYERQHGLGPYKPGKGHTVAPLAQQSQNVIYQHISGVRTTLQQLSSALGSRQAAWHAMHTGSYTTTDPKTGKPVQHFLKGIGTGGDDGYLNAAYNTMTGTGGLTPGDLQFLQHLGLTNVQQRLAVVPNYTPSPGAASSPH